MIVRKFFMLCRSDFVLGMSTVLLPEISSGVCPKRSIELYKIPNLQVSKFFKAVSFIPSGPGELHLLLRMVLTISSRVIAVLKRFGLQITFFSEENIVSW